MKKLLALLLLFGIVSSCEVLQTSQSYQDIENPKAASINISSIDISNPDAPVTKYNLERVYTYGVNSTLNIRKNEDIEFIKQKALQTCTDLIYTNYCILYSVNDEVIFEEELNKLLKALKDEQKRFIEAKEMERKRRLLAIKKQRQAKLLAEKKEKEATRARFQAYLDGKKNTCRAYGFTEENAIARCVQQEINNELARLENQLAQANAQANAQARANAQSRSRAMSNYSRCLSTAGETFGSCANAWNGYTPKPAKKVYRCDYDVFGNQISSTCREQ